MKNVKVTVSLVFAFLGAQFVHAGNGDTGSAGDGKNIECVMQIENQAKVTSTSEIGAGGQGAINYGVLKNFFISATAFKFPNSDHSMVSLTAVEVSTKEEYSDTGKDKDSAQLTLLNSVGAKVNVSCRIK